MPHAALKLVPGTDTQETQALNENSGISQTNLIRFFPDRNGVALVQKLGGWQQFYGLPMPAHVRALWAWEDLNLNTHLAVGTETVVATGSALLGVITNGALADITPTTLTDNITPVLQTTAGSASVEITDTTVPGITNYNSVYIPVQLSIGGIVLFGLYACDPDGFLSGTAYTVFSIDQLGNLLPATSNSTTTTLPGLTTVGPPGGIGIGSNTVTVNLPNHGYVPGVTFPVLVPTTVGGITFFGNYVVQTVIDANNFTIVVGTPATSTATGFINGGLARFIYNFGVGVLPGGTGYGIGTYGSGGYGTGSPVLPTTGTEIDAIDWNLGNWGEILIANPDRAPPANGTPFQPIYQWPPGSASATIITNAPPVNDGMFIAMPQRQIIAWGSTQTGIQDPLLIRWCDVGNYNSWIPTVVNQAGSYRIPKGSRIVAGVQGPQQAIFWTDIDVWSMQYIGLPYVYGFNEIGTGCGLIGRKAAASVNGIYFWMGYSQFFWLTSNGVQVLPCTVWDFVFQNLDRNNVQKIRIAVNSLFSEVSWFFPSLAGGGEVDSYVKYNTELNVWDFGTLGRTAWIDQSVLGPPIGANAQDLELYQHETSPDADGAPLLASFQTGYFAISEGDVKSFVDWIWPDMKWGPYNQAQTATVQITFYVTDYPGDTPQVFGPYSVTQATEYFYTRFRGRLMSVQISSGDLGSFWRIGLLRYRFAPDGKI
jgi:hypothetical protein